MLQGSSFFSDFCVINALFFPGLLDPKWIEQRDRAIQEKREQEDVYAAGSSMDVMLKKLAERRTDIFGSGVAETQIGKKVSQLS